MHLTQAYSDPVASSSLCHRCGWSWSWATSEVPSLFSGSGTTRSRCSLPEAGGLYERPTSPIAAPRSGRVKEVQLTDTGVEAVLSLKSDVQIPSDLDAQVHSQTAVGEQYRRAAAAQRSPAALKNGDVIPRDAPRCRRHQRAAGCDQPWAAGDPARQPEDGDRRGLHRVRQAWARSFTGS